MSIAQLEQGQQEIERGRLSQASTVAAAVPALDDILLVFSTDTDSVLWLSDAAARLFQAPRNGNGNCAGTDTVGLSSGDPIFNELAPVLDRFKESVLEVPDIDVGQEITVQGKQFHCRLAVLPASAQQTPALALRLIDAAPVSADIQAYLNEREKLFTTSRTISVSEMATTLAHEINQPIGSIANILNGTRLRLEKTDCDEAILTALGRALEQTQFATRIIARIRDFTQTRQPAKVDCSVKDLIIDSVRLLDWVLAKSSTSVELVMPAETITVNGDPTMLQQVFTNLIRNAVDAMTESPVSNRDLTISLSLSDSSIRIEFDDAGHGLSKTAEENLFVPFVTQKAQGMGVGLNICRSFVELHQGRLWLAPNDHGGCTACVMLPVSIHLEEGSDDG